MDIPLDIVEKSKKAYTKPIYVKSFTNLGQITCLEVSQYDWSQDVVLIGFKSSILLGYLKFTENVELNILNEFQVPCQCTSISISLETNLSLIPPNIVFAAAGSDFKIRVFRSDLASDNICKVLDKHTDYINDLKYDYDNKYLASASDDNSVKIWEVENYECCSSLQLNFPAIAVQWHKDDPGKLLVADKMGLIRQYHVETLKPILTLDAEKMLSACHWSPSNLQTIGSLQLGELSIWDVSNPGCPASSSLIFTEAGGCLKFSTHGEMVAALNPIEGALKVFKIGSDQPIFSTFINIPTNFSWHYRYAAIIACDDTKFCIWRINTI